MVAKRARSASRRKNPGPFSRDQSLSGADRRTRAGGVMKGVIAELMQHIGDASAPQRLLIQSAALKATRLMMLAASFWPMIRLRRDPTIMHWRG
jgi:hypothetical protein